MQRIVRFVKISLALAVIAPVLTALFLLYDYFTKWARHQTYPIRLDYLDREELGPYYMNLETGETLGSDPVLVTTDGITWINPIKTTHLAYKHYREYLDSDRTLSHHLEAFLSLADAFIEYARIDEETAAWPLYIVYRKDQQVPWLHAMAQGQIIGVLCRAYQETKQQRYLDIAFKAMRTFELPIDRGGVRCEAERGVFYEEYAFPEPNKQHHTLNGMMSALMGLYDLHKLTGDARAKALFDTGIKTIRDNLPAYDFGYCSTYDLRHENGEFPVMQARYNQVHVGHLTVLSALTGDPYFKAVADLWDLKMLDPVNRLRLTIWYAQFMAREIRDHLEWYGFVGVLQRVLVRIPGRLRGALGKL